MNSNLRRLGAAAIATASIAGVAATAIGPAEAVTTSAPGQVVARGGLVAHATPSTHTARIYTVPNGARVSINCKVEGTVVGGNKWWYLLADHDGTAWISARYVRNLGSIPEHCDPADGYYSGRIETRLNVREGASTGDRVTSVAAAGTIVKIQCQTQETPTRRWLLTSGGRWLSATYVEAGSGVRYCINGLIS